MDSTKRMVKHLSSPPPVRIAAVTTRKISWLRLGQAEMVRLRTGTLRPLEQRYDIMSTSPPQIAACSQNLTQLGKLHVKHVVQNVSFPYSSGGQEQGTWWSGRICIGHASYWRTGYSLTLIDLPREITFDGCRGASHA